jgi:hypothetical protein
MCRGTRGRCMLAFCLSVCLSVCLSGKAWSMHAGILSVCLSVCQGVVDACWHSVCLSVCLSVWEGVVDACWHSAPGARLGVRRRGGRPAGRQARECLLLYRFCLSVSQIEDVVDRNLAREWQAELTHRRSGRRTGQRTDRQTDGGAGVQETVRPGRRTAGLHYCLTWARHCLTRARCADVHSLLQGWGSFRRGSACGP